ncbi:hypothetical protein P5673_022405 [Acropora cervicornis]|uniref:CCHC-type domain-containing protein n=1 Tax=Acropora cervicornis TaxID=6130 RepID=A0AAD9UZN6_ACRCE|nr:hypothetical protein P5673_022405 [Acropora cervicornis]
MEQLQLEVEEQLFNQDEDSLVEMIEILGIEDDVAGKTRMQKIKIIRKEIDNKLESGEKFARTCLDQLFAYMKGTKAASEVYQQLATVCQQSNESPQQFLLRALDLRNKVNFASQESDCGFNYGLSLIQKTFAKSFETGLRDDILASILRATLCTPGLTDEELMKQVNELASQQAERNTKLATEHQKMTKVDSCEISKGVGEPRSGNPDGDESQKILSEIRQMRSAINDLQGRVNAQRSQTSKPDWGQFPYRGRGGSYQPKYPSWGCQNCKEHGRGEECDHCFACGSSGHVARGCPRNRNRSSQKAKKPLDPSDSTFISHLTSQRHATVAGLVGKRCTVNGEVNSHSVEVLWDTGAQVSITSNEFLKNFPGVIVKDILELLDTKLNLMAANSSEMPYIGLVELNFRLSSCNPDLKVPFLVTEQCLDSPLIGFNVIEEIIKHSNGDAALSQVITSSFTDLDTQTASVFVNFIESLNQEEFCCIKTTKRDTTIPPKQSLRVTGRAGGPVGGPTPVLFEPDETNPWSNGLEISETLLTSVTPFEVKIKEPDSGDNGIQQEAPGSGTTRPVHPLDGELGVASMCIPRHIKDIDLEGLIPAQKETALKLLAEEVDAFSKNDNDTVACSAKSQDQGQVNWVSALKGDHTVLPADPVGTDTSTVPVIDLKQAQATDQNDQCSKVQQIPTPQVKELSDDSSSDDESAVIQTNLHTGQTLEEMVTGEHPKPLVEVKPPAPTQPEYAIPDNSYRGETSSDLTVPEGINDARSENGDEQDPPTQNDNSQLDSFELELRPKRHRHQPTLLTYNTLGNPTYETQAATHLPTNPILYQHPVIFGYPSSYLQYPLTSPVFHAGNQYLTYQPVVYQPKDDPMHVPITMDHGHVSVPGYVY